MSTKSSINSEKKLREKKAGTDSLFLAFSSFALFLLFIGVAFLKPNPVASYIPLVALLGLSALVFLPQKALAIAYLLLAIFMAPFFPYVWREKALWEMTLFYSLALQFYTASLVIEELKLFFALPHLPAPEVQANEGEKQQLQEEISWLKEEAELRRIEKGQLLAEVDHLKLQLQQIEEQQRSCASELVEKKREKAELHKEVERQLGEKNQLHAQLQAQLQTKIDQLKLQIEEKQALNSAAINYPAEIALLQNQTQELKSALEEKKQVVLQLQNEKIHNEARYNQLESGLQQILAEKAELLLELEKVKVEVVQLQEKMSDSTLPVLPEQLQLYQQKMAQVQGLYTQLKSQFEDKSKILSQTRKELFQLEGKLLKKDREEKLKEIGEESWIEKILLEDLQRESQENQQLLEEIQELENLFGF